MRRPRSTWVGTARVGVTYPASGDRVPAPSRGSRRTLRPIHATGDCRRLLGSTPPARRELPREVTETALNRQHEKREAQLRAVEGAVGNRDHDEFAWPVIRAKRQGRTTTRRTGRTTATADEPTAGRSGKLRRRAPAAGAGKNPSVRRNHHEGGDSGHSWQVGKVMGDRATEVRGFGALDVDHQLRGPEAMAERQAVLQAVRERGLPSSIVSDDASTRTYARTVISAPPDFTRWQFTIAVCPAKNLTANGYRFLGPIIHPVAP